VATGPEGTAASRGRLRAGHADREQVIEALKTAFVDGRLTKNELAARAGRALAARTYADLAALTADIPAEPAGVQPPTAEPAVAVALPAVAVPAVAVPDEPAGAVPGPARSPAPPIRRPLAKAATVSGVCLGIAAAAIEIGAHIDPNVPGPNPHHALVAACFSLALGAVIVAAFTVFLGAAVAIAQRRSQSQPPPRSGADGRADDGERPNGTGHNPVPPGPRPDETRADLRARTSRPPRRRIPARPFLVPGGVSPVPGTA